MGFWDTSLYGGDFALDLRSTIAALARLPFDSERLVELLVDAERQAATNPADEDHATFWLVVADQFAKRGLAQDTLRQRAIRIIDDGGGALERVGLTGTALQKRRQMLEGLRARLAGSSGAAAKPRKVLRAPQPFLFDVGDILLYPTCQGRNINPYLPSKERLSVRTPTGLRPWAQDGWGAVTIVDRGRAFEYLTWYRPLTVLRAMPDRPSIEQLRDDEVCWRLELPGTCSPSHFRKLEIERIASVRIDRARLDGIFPARPAGESAAIGDLSIANRLRVMPTEGTHDVARSHARQPNARTVRLREIVL